MPDNCSPSLAITSSISSQLIANLTLSAFEANPPAIQEILLQSKSEQTFTGILANQIMHYEEFGFTQLSEKHPGAVLLEFKGTDYQKIENGKIKPSRNFHDLSVVNQQGELEVIIENKFWYHFDGSKGVKKPAPNRGIHKQLGADIFKIRKSLSEESRDGRGFILLHIVTPLSPELLPKTYQTSHQALWQRAEQNLEQYRRKGLEGVLKILGEFLDTDLVDYSTTSSPLTHDKGFLDIICAEVKL